MVKNETRLSSLMGTWTVSTNLKIASYDVQAAFVVYMTPNPMRHYGCSIDSCLEANNQICQRNQECHEMSTVVSEWSDVSAFFYQELKSEGKFPYPSHGSIQTGIWVGPYDVVLAQRTENPNQFTLRYVQTAATPFLSRRSNNDTLFSADPVFEAAFGPSAVQNTIPRQATFHHGDNPYEAYKHTCEKGAIPPLLPQLTFLFENNNIYVEADVHTLLVPDPKNAALNRVMPFFAHEVNTMKDQLGASLEGPYCFENNPRAGWVLNITLDPQSLSKTALSMTHGCVEGFPCIPPAMEIAHNNRTAPHVDPVCPQVNIPIVNVWIWKLCSTVLFALWGTTLLFLCRRNCQPNHQTTSGHSNETTSNQEHHHHEVLQSGNGVVSQTHGELEEPLLAASTASSNEDVADDNDSQQNKNQRSDIEAAPNS